MVWVLVQIWSTWTSVILLAPSVPAASKGLRNWFRGRGGSVSPTFCFDFLFYFILFYSILIYLISFQIFSNFKLIFVSSLFLMFLHFFKIFYVFTFCSLCQNFVGEMLEPKEKPRKFRSAKFCSLLHSHFVLSITFSFELYFRCS